MTASSASRWVAVAVGLGVAGLWAVVAVSGPQGGAPVEDPQRGLAVAVGPPFWVAWMIFTALALVAAGGAFARVHLVTLVAALVSLVPVGLYFLLLPGLFRWIGILDVVLFAVAAVTWVRVRGGNPATGEDPG